MLAPEFVSMEIKEWVDSEPRLNKEEKELFIEFAKRLVESYQFYYKLVHNIDGQDV